MVRLENITGNLLSYPANTNLYKRVVFIKNKFVGRIEFLSVFLLRFLFEVRLRLFPNYYLRSRQVE